MYETDALPTEPRKLRLWKILGVSNLSWPRRYDGRLLMADICVKGEKKTTRGEASLVKRDCEDPLRCPSSRGLLRSR